MKIRNIIIENFFCYVNENKFEFEDGLNIISGMNNGGKSHLFNAFYWVLFNRVYVDKKVGTSEKEWKNSDEEKSLILLPEKLISDSNDNEILSSRVELNIVAEYYESKEENSQIIPYKFVREQSYKKNGEHLIKFGSSVLIIEYVINGETKIVPPGEHSILLNSVFPQTTRKFMWFQGETMDNLLDFSNPATLTYAIKEISYFPMYVNMFEVAKTSSSSIDKKITKQLNDHRKTSTEQQSLLQDINRVQENNEILVKNIGSLNSQIAPIHESIFLEEQKLKGYDKYTDLKIKLSKIDSEIRFCFSEIESLTSASKESLINKWMLFKCDKIIKSSEKNLKKILSFVTNNEDTPNPVPITLPGPEYVKKMIDDHICYICERPIEDDSDAFVALQRRLEDFKNNQELKVLNDNYTELNRSRRNLLARLPEFKEEIEDLDERIQKKIDRRKKLTNQKNAILSDSGVSSSTEIIDGSETASQILSKINSLNNSLVSVQGRIKQFEINLDQNKFTLKNLLEKRTNSFSANDLDEIPEVKAKDYIQVILEILERLRVEAYDKLIADIQLESNKLYNLYLGNRNQGKIIINNGVSVVDLVSEKVLTNLNTAEVLATKLAVANSFLSLSEKKMNRSFPMIADAPTSDLDHLNTASFTTNLSKSFKQMIIMSKDYAKLNTTERNDFIKEADIKKYYKIEKALIDKEKKPSRSNEKTLITIIK